MIKEWENEPDRWEGEMMAIIRHPTSLHLCGYVAVPPSHPLYGKDYNDEISALSVALYFNVHGGITFAENRLPDQETQNNLWWFGFDCAHAGDYVPGHPNFESQTYRNFDYVKSEVLSLAKQLARWRDPDAPR